MSRVFDGTADYFTTSGQDTWWGVNGGTQYCWMFAWFRSDATPTVDRPILVRHNGTNGMKVWHDNNDPPGAGNAALGVDSVTIKTTNVATTGWACVYAHSNHFDHYIELNGDTVNAVSSSTDDTVASLTGVETSIGADVTGGDFFDGKIGLVCGGLSTIGFLTTDERAALAAGMDPRRVIRDARLDSVWRDGFWRTGNMADEWSGGYTMTEVSAPGLDADGPPVELWPKRVIVPMPTGAAPGDAGAAPGEFLRRYEHKPAPNTLLRM